MQSITVLSKTEKRKAPPCAQARAPGQPAVSAGPIDGGAWFIAQKAPCCGRLVGSPGITGFWEIYTSGGEGGVIQSYRRLCLGGQGGHPERQTPAWDTREGYGILIREGRLLTGWINKAYIDPSVRISSSIRVS